MKMKSEFYSRIIEKYHELKKRKCLDDLLNLFPNVPHMTIESIIFQECQGYSLNKKHSFRKNLPFYDEISFHLSKDDKISVIRKTKKTYHFHASPQNVKKYYNRLMKESEKNWSKCGILLKMADEVDLSPALMAKLILEYHYKENEQDSQPLIQKPKIKINDFLKNPSLIDDAFLAAEIKMCILEDDAYGHTSDIIRKFIGQEYEHKLKDELTKLGLTFADEHQLRERGYDKTPDIKLDVPIATDGHIINWIESKASFGDKERHKEYLTDQYWSYCNRFGPGLVIYWAGYIEELNTDKEQGIMICDHLPCDMIKMDPTILVNQSYCI